MRLFKNKISREKTIGLALGGGGVRGLAHAGVLSVLDREGIPIKAIAGSSMGAIVAAAYALNSDFKKLNLLQRVKTLEIALPASLNEDRLGKDSFLTRLRQFIDTERIIVDAALGWGILPTENVQHFIKELMLGKRLEEGRIAIAVVATDLITGEKIVFRDGPADFAVQASSALPGFLPPVRDRNRLLADGAFVDLVPTEVVRETLVDLVIAVDVDQEGMSVEVHNGLEAFLRAVELCARHHKNHHLKSANLVIRPDFGKPINPLDISKAELCIEAGVRVAEQMLPQIRDLLSHHGAKK